MLVRWLKGRRLFRFTPVDATPLDDGVYIVSAALNRINEEPVIEVEEADGANAELIEDGRGPRSEPYRVTIDTIAPESSDAPDMLTSSDTGMSVVDNVTSKMEPAFQGVGEPNTKVRVVGNRIGSDVAIIGRGIVGNGWSLGGYG